MIFCCLNSNSWSPYFSMSQHVFFCVFFLVFRREHQKAPKFSKQKPSKAFLFLFRCLSFLYFSIPFLFCSEKKKLLGGGLMFLQQIPNRFPVIIPPWLVGSYRGDEITIFSRIPFNQAGFNDMSSVGLDHNNSPQCWMIEIP